MHVGPNVGTVIYDRLQASSNVHQYILETLTAVYETEAIMTSQQRIKITEKQLTKVTAPQKAQGAPTLPAPDVPGLPVPGQISYNNGQGYFTVHISYPGIKQNDALTLYVQFHKADGNGNLWSFTHTVSAAEATAKEVFWDITRSILNPANYLSVTLTYAVLAATSKPLDLKLVA